MNNGSLLLVYIVISKYLHVILAAKTDHVRKYNSFSSSNVSDWYRKNLNLYSFLPLPGSITIPKQLSLTKTKLRVIHVDQLLCVADLECVLI